MTEGEAVTAMRAVLGVRHGLRCELDANLLASIEADAAVRPVMVLP
jgi:hypothetical protein